METNDRTYCVYVHTNKINGKMYIGQTCQKPERRWNSGYGYRNCSYFYNAIRKYGWENFKHEVIASNLTLEEANKFESILIEKLDTRNPDKGYNLRTGGKNGLLAEETKAKIKKAVSGENAPMLGKHLSEEAKEKIRKARQGKYCGKNNPNYGKHHSVESRKKMSESAKKRCTDEWRLNISKHLKMKVGKDNPHAQPIICLDTQTIYEAKSVASRDTGINTGHIGECCRGERNMAGGFKWRYIYDTTKRDGTVVFGAITLGLISEEKALAQLNNTTK